MAVTVEPLSVRRTILTIVVSVLSFEEHFSVSGYIAFVGGGGGTIYKLKTKLLTALVYPTLFITWGIADRVAR
jgi:Na+/pantothenate symporter